MIGRFLALLLAAWGVPPHAAASSRDETCCIGRTCPECRPR